MCDLNYFIWWGEGGAEEEETPEDAEARDVELAKQEFGVVDFNDESYLNNFFMTNNDFEAGNKIDQLEQWQSSIKRGLRVLVFAWCNNRESPGPQAQHTNSS